MRTITDGEGRSWRVWHVRPQSEVLKTNAPAMHGGWLCFESAGDKRRLVSPPEDWERLAESALVELLGHAARVMARV